MSRIFRRPPAMRADATYLNGLAHDLRQPLMLLTSHIAMMDAGSPLRAAMVEVDWLLDELFAEKHAESSTNNEVPARDVSLREVFEAAALTSRPLSTRYPFEIEIVPTDLVVRAPRSWMYRLMANLVANAIKHSGGSRVSMTAVILRDGRVQLRVKDDGKGIKEDLLSSIMATRYELDPERKDISTSGGSRRGLRAAIQLVEAMGGTVECISNKLGTEWVLTLGVEVLRRRSLTGSNGKPLSGALVVVLDDEPDIAALVASTFDKLGADTLAFTDDLEMLRVTQRLVVDLYILDFMLGDNVDADQVIPMLADRSTDSDIVILTANPNEVARRGLQVQVPVFSKPLNQSQVDQLCEIIVKRLDSRRSTVE
jgi:CheY-like chemotaxis protein